MSRNNPTADSAERDERIRAVVADVIRRRAAGENLDESGICAKHAELMPELAKRLQALRDVDQAERIAAEPLPETGSLDGPAQGIATETGGPLFGTRPSAPTPARIGNYSIKRTIASGGMGTVYEALQEKPRRTVAVKLMRAGIASRSALRRFEFESQLLARLQHPGIAQVYHAETESGRLP